MDNNKMVPEIRFPGFIDTWEQCKCSDVLIERNVQHPQNSDYPLVSFTVENGVTPKTERYEREQLVTGDKKFKKYKETRLDDIVYNPANLKFGAIARNKYGNAVFSPIYITYEVNKTIASPLFIEMVVTRDSFIKNALQYQQGTVYERMAVNTEDFAALAIAIPSKEEQLIIGDYFNKIDNLITLHQRKLDEIKDYKKGMLKKMFPQNGELFPEIRFPEFTDPWEQRKLSDIYKDIGNAFVGTATPYYVEEGHFYLESNNIKDGQINHNTEVFINDEFYEKQKDKWLHTGDMVMVQSGHVGHAAVIPEELDCSAAHALIMFRNPKVEIEPYFLNYQYQTNKAKKKIENITTGNTIKHILASEMQEFVVDVTSYGEQEKVAAFFRELDNLITLHQRKLDEMRELKKGLLQKMFI